MPSMKDFDKQARVISLKDDDLLIEAFVTSSKTGLDDPVSFRASAIAHIVGDGEEGSVIALKSGLNVTVRKSYNALSAEIWSNPQDLSLLDLKPHSGRGQEQAAPSFNKAAEEKPVPPAASADFEIKAVFRFCGSRTEKVISIPDTSIEWAQMQAFSPSDITGKPCVRLLLKPGKAVDGQQALMLDFPQDEFLKTYNSARAEGKNQIDLTGAHRSIAITAFVRPSRLENFVLHTFRDSDIDWTQTEETKGFNGKPCYILRLKSDKGPFGNGRMIIEMRQSRFMALYNSAKLKGKGDLDLSRETRRKQPWYKFGK